VVPNPNTKPIGSESDFDNEGVTKLTGTGGAKRRQNKGARLVEQSDKRMSEYFLRFFC
jgi:hypothetical protein